jgi:Phosphatidylinositol N-acetylglucosaminyltransferase subunit Y
MKLAASPPAPYLGYIFLAASALLLAAGTHAVLFSALLPARTGEPSSFTSVIINVKVLDALARDTHYKYLGLFSVPVCAYFVIANWVGWQFFRNS